MRSHEVEHLMQMNFEFCTRYNEEIDVMMESPNTICDPEGLPIEYPLKHIDLASDWDIDLEFELSSELIEMKDSIKESMSKGLEKVAQIALGNRTLLEVIEQKNKQIESLRCDIKTLQAEVIRLDKRYVDLCRSIDDEERHEPHCDIEADRYDNMSETEAQWMALYEQ